jgi:hypothetical protein
MSDNESQQALHGAASTPIPAESGSREQKENAQPPSGRANGVAARTRQQQKQLALIPLFFTIQ